MRHSRLNGLNAGEKYVYSKQCQGVYFSSSHTRFLFEVGAFSIKSSKKLYFLKERRGAIAFGFKEGKVIRGGAHSIKCNRILCLFERDPRRSFLRLFLLLFSSK